MEEKIENLEGRFWKNGKKGHILEKVSLNEEKTLRADIREIQDYRWYRLWSLKAFTSPGIFYRTVGKRVTRDAVWKALLCLYNLWGPYELYRKGKALARRR